MIEQITSYEDNAKALVITQYKDKENFNKLIKIFTDQLQIREAKLFDLLNKRWLDLGEGVQLDLIGKIVGQPRNGMNDEDYVDAIDVRAAINVSGGEAEAIIAACALLLGASKVHLRRLYPANIQVWVLVSTAEDLSEETELLAGVTGSGFGFYLSVNTSTPFTLSEVTGESNPDGAGLGEVGQTGVGGILAEVYHGV